MRNDLITIIKSVGPDLIAAERAAQDAIRLSARFIHTAVEERARLKLGDLADQQLAMAADGFKSALNTASILNQAHLSFANEYRGDAGFGPDCPCANVVEPSDDSVVVPLSTRATA